MRFLHPALAWWFLAAAAVMIALRLARRRPLHLATTSRWVFEPAYRASLFRRLPTAVFTLALILVGCALMDPVLPFAEVELAAQEGLLVRRVGDESLRRGRRAALELADEGAAPFPDLLRQRACSHCLASSLDVPYTGKLVSPCETA